PLALTAVQAPGELGVDIAVGSMQRFGVPLGLGGPHAAYMAVTDKLKRLMPGRLIGQSVDATGQPAYRLALQTREQHIRRGDATSNICTAQALLANMAAAFAIYHGPEGLRVIADRVHGYAAGFAAAAKASGYSVAGESIFDTVVLTGVDADDLQAKARKEGIAILAGDDFVGVSFDETTNEDTLARLSKVFGFEIAASDAAFTPSSPRDGAWLTQEIFHTVRSETQMMRYLRILMDKDLALDRAMIPLGSCTMKLNAAAEMMPVTWANNGALHPFLPADCQAGTAVMARQLEDWLNEITGFAATSLQPNAGSQGEYAGLMCIRAYHHANGDTRRTKCLIPTSAHGTNPASAVIAGLSVVPVRCADNGDIDLDDLREKAAVCGDELAALMITYPSTHGVFEEGIREACDIVHEQGGQVYMDGANMNAQVGLTSPGKIGADVCHLNLHKTFCIPHGGGGPGMGPIGVAAHLSPYLPTHPVSGEWGRVSGEDDILTHPTPLTTHTIAAAPYGSPSILPISWMYIATMGPAGLQRASERAILNANYLAARLRGAYDILYTGPSGTVAHEFIVDVRPFEKSAGVTVDDFAKRLMDYGFHAPTMSWPVAGTLMVEPTESESKAELDRFADAMLGLRDEIARVERGDWPTDDNPLKGAPHTAAAVTVDDWTHAYPRSVAAYPDARQKRPGAKFWPAVGRIDNPYGDRNLVCSCEPMTP
ncbi:MAG: aminomethyl-transferring glycine dehydrogenase, partial [Planctomycetota bacterium]